LIGRVRMSSPSRVASSLRQIAAKIDMSKNPDRSLVQADLRRVVHSITREDRVRKVAAEVARIARDDAADAADPDVALQGVLNDVARLAGAPGPVE